MEIKPIPNESFEAKHNDKETELVTLTNSKGTIVQITNYGARVVSFLVKDAAGVLRDIIIGPATIQDYINAKERYFNAIIGRYAGRIAGGRFEVDGVSYSATINNDGNTLHGGARGLSEAVWEICGRKENKVRLRAVLKDGEDGFPGDLEVQVKYVLSDEDELIIEYHAQTDKDTIINLTNHAFFNLGLDHGDTVCDHKLKIDAAQYTPINAARIPTGEDLPVKGTVFDFTRPRLIGRHIEAGELLPTRGYDHNYVLNNYPSRNGAPVFAASVTCAATGLKLEVLTTEPGLQLYTGNYLSAADTGKYGVHYKPHCALCLETQHFPDSPNHPGFPATLLKKGEEFVSSTVYKISAEIKKQ